MSIRPLRAEPCWQVNDAETGMPYEPWYEEGWPHFRTREEAEKSRLEDLERLAEDVEPGELRKTPWFVLAQSFPSPCVGIFCDSADCGAAEEPLDWTGEGSTHADPDNPLPFDLRDMGWLELDGLHFCTDCAERGVDRLRAALAEPDRRPGPGQLEVPW